MKYGLIGNPLGHSFSKPIHEMLATYTYDIHPLTEDEFDPFMEQHNFCAINVTIPYKQRVIPYLDSLDPAAQSIGAVNCIVNRDGKLTGYNTDFGGFDYMMKANGVSVTDKKVIVLGTGGAAQAVLACLKAHHASDIICVKRTATGGAITYEDAFANHSDADVIINTSPVGMYPNVDASPVDVTHFPNCYAVLDLIYNPIETKFTEQGRSLGMIAVTGLEMLVAQALYAVEIFTDTHISEDRIPEIYEKIRSCL